MSDAPSYGPCLLTYPSLSLGPLSSIRRPCRLLFHTHTPNGAWSTQGLYTEMKFEKPSRIQAETLPMILLPPHSNLIAQAHNGSGKTACFVLGMLSRVDPAVRSPQALCICPTRELVVQNVQV